MLRKRPESPRLLNLGLNGRPERSQWRSGGAFWHNLAWPDIGQAFIQNIDCVITWYGYRSTEKGYSEAKQPEELNNCCTKCKVNRWSLSEMSVKDDHVHILIQIWPRESIADDVKKLKGGTSRIIRTEFPEL